jgi:hypothetical protein
MTNEGADQPVQCQKNEESLIPVRSGLTGSTGTGKKKALPVPSMTQTSIKNRWTSAPIEKKLKKIQGSVRVRTNRNR